MFPIILFLFVAIIINGLFNDLVKGTKFGLTQSGMNVSFAAIVAVGGFWNPILWVITATVLFTIFYQDLNGKIYNTRSI